MKYNEYIEFCSLLKELNSLCEKLSKHNYRGNNIKSGYDTKSIICILKEVVAKAKYKLSTIDKLKQTYAKEGEVVDVVIVDDYFLVYSVKEKFDVRISNGERNIKQFEGLDIFVSLSGDKKDKFILAKKIQNQNNEESYVCYDCNLYGTDKKICEDVKSWKFIGENIVVFELNDDKGIVVYDKYNNDIIFENVDKISPLEERIGNYDPDETYLVEKCLHIDDTEILLGFFINEDGYAVSDVFDSYGNFYRLIDRENNRYLNKRLESIFGDITEMYKNNEVKSNIENILVKKYKNKQ